MKFYFVLSFLLFALLAGALTVNWWLSLSWLDMPWRAILPAFGVIGFVWSLLMALVAARTKYKS